MSIFSMCGVGFVCICALLVVRENGYKSFAVVISSLCAVLMIAFSLNNISSGLSELKTIMTHTVNIKYGDVALKSFAIAFVCEVCSDMIKELGSDTIAKGIEMVGKAEILLLCLSPMSEILYTVLSLSGQAYT